MEEKDKAIKSLAAWCLKRNKDYYPAEALDEDECFYNGQIGNCGLNCPCYILGKCPIKEEINNDK